MLSHIPLCICAYIHTTGFPGGANSEELACQCRRQKRHGLNPQIWKIPWRRAWQPIPGFLPGECHGQRSLAGSSPWGCKESDMIYLVSGIVGWTMSTCLACFSPAAAEGHCWPGMCAKSRLTLCDPMNCSPLGSSVHGILQARILEWVATLSSGESSWPKDRTRVSCISCNGRRVLTTSATWEAQQNLSKPGARDLGRSTTLAGWILGFAEKRGECSLFLLVEPL